MQPHARDSRQSTLLQKKTVESATLLLWSLDATFDCSCVKAL